MTAKTWQCKKLLRIYLVLHSGNHNHYLYTIKNRAMAKNYFNRYVRLIGAIQKDGCITFSDMMIEHAWSMIHLYKEA